MLIPPHSGLCLNKRINHSAFSREYFRSSPANPTPQIGDEGFSVVEEVGLVVGIRAELHPGPQIFPVAGQVFKMMIGQSGEVIHQGVTALVPVGRGPAVQQFLVVRLEEMVGTVFLGGQGGKALHEDSVQIKFLHPLKMAIHGLGIQGTEDPGDASVGMPESGGIGFVLVKSGQVGPEVDRAMPRFEFSVLLIVMESQARSISLGPEPSLVSTEQLSLDAGWIVDCALRFRGGNENFVSLFQGDIRTKGRLKQKKNKNREGPTHRIFSSSAVSSFTFPGWVSDRLLVSAISSFKLYS